MKRSVAFQLQDRRIDWYLVYIALTGQGGINPVADKTLPLLSGICHSTCVRYLTPPNGNAQFYRLHWGDYIGIQSEWWLIEKPSGIGNTA